MPKIRYKNRYQHRGNVTKEWEGNIAVGRLIEETGMKATTIKAIEITAGDVG